MHYSQKIRRAGISLIEVVFASILVGGVVVGSLSLLGASLRTQVAANNLLTGPMLANMLMAEIMSMPYEDPEDGGGTQGIDTGELNVTRLDFDDVDDYRGWSKSTVQARDGSVLPGSTGWTRTADVYWADESTGTWWFMETGLKRIEVQVTAPDGTVTYRYGLRSRDGTLQQAPNIDKTVVTLVEASLSVGSTGNVALGATCLLNHVEDPNEN